MWPSRKLEGVGSRSSRSLRRHRGITPEKLRAAGAAGADFLRCRARVVGRRSGSGQAFAKPWPPRLTLQLGDQFSPNRRACVIVHSETLVHRYSIQRAPRRVPCGANTDRSPAASSSCRQAEAARHHQAGPVRAADRVAMFVHVIDRLETSPRRSSVAVRAVSETSLGR